VSKLAGDGAVERGSQLDILYVKPRIPDGLTDIDNLIPICNKHHHLVHEGGWQLHLAPDRSLTITQPGGIVTTNGPPTIRAA
jgi:hypothetical protein